MYRLAPDVEKSVAEAKKGLILIDYIFYSKVLHLINCKLPSSIHLV